MRDIQNLKDNRGVEIQKVGIKDLEIPLNVQRKDAENQVVCAKAKISVSLPAHYKGTHMSRFVEVINFWKNKNLLGVSIEGCVKDVVQKLEAKSGYLKLSFKYFIDKESETATDLASCSSIENIS